MKCLDSMDCGKHCQLVEIGRTELHQSAPPFVAALLYRPPGECCRHVERVVVRADRKDAP